jgi:hypothetical protein
VAELAGVPGRVTGTLGREAVGRPHKRRGRVVSAKLATYVTLGLLVALSVRP